MNIFRSIGFLLVFLTYQGAQAQSSFKFSIHNQYESTRAMGMGNAFSALANDESAIFYNPAALKKLEKSKLNFFLKGALNPDILDVMDDVEEAKEAADESQAYIDLINANLDKNFILRAPSLGGIYAGKNWSLAVILMDLNVDLSFQDRGIPELDLRAYQDTTVAYAHAWDLPSWIGANISFGVTGKAIYRAFLDKRFNVPDLVVSDSVIDEKDAKEGLAVDFDLGTQWTWDGGGYNPTLALVVRNVLDGGYMDNFEVFADGDRGDPQDLIRRVDFGGALELPKWWVWKQTNLVFELKNMLHDNWTFKKGIHLGAESLWEVSSWFNGGWRVGLNQGHFTAGFTGQIWAFKLDLATYNVEVGTESNANSTRMYMFTTSLDF